jgi:hypothetical protein
MRESLQSDIASRLASIEQSINARNLVPIIDPTVNAKDALAVAVKHEAELREAEKRRIDELRLQQSAFDQEIRKVRAEGQASLSAAESKRIDALAMAESRRLDAVLAEQKNAVALASEKQAAQATALATQVLASAETLRSQVAATAAANAAETKQLRDSMDKRLTIVEQNQYQAGGATQQRGENRQFNQWLIGILAFVIGIVIAHFWK